MVAYHPRLGDVHRKAKNESMSLKARYSLCCSVAATILLAAFAFAVYVQFYEKLFASATESLVSRLDHEWEHFAFHSDDLSKAHLPESKHLNLRIWKNSVLIHDFFPPGVAKSFEGTRAGLKENRIVARLARYRDGIEYVVEGFDEIDGTLRYVSLLKYLLGLSCAVALLVVVPLTRLLASAMLAPFGELAKRTSEIDAGDLSYRFPDVPLVDEYGVLVRNFNSLLERVERSFQHAKRFALNVSHEMRTPLAVIHGEAQFLLRKPREIADYEKALKIIADQSAILKAVVTRLLAIAEVERAEQEARRMPIDVKKAAHDTLRAVKASVIENSKIVEIESAEPTLIYFGHPDLLASVLNNLIENALKYARNQVRVSLGRQSSFLELEVHDDGPGIPLARRADVMQPFFRNGRDDGREKRGYGLGLSIVKACVDAAQGKILLLDSPLGGLTVRVTLPEKNQN